MRHNITATAITSINMVLLVDFPSSSRTVQVQALAEPALAEPSPPPECRIRFSQEIEVKFVANLTLDHRCDIWFSSQEMKKFRYQNALLMRHLQSNNMSLAEYAERHIHDTSCFLGIESYMTRETPPEIMSRRQMLRTAILNEQKRQRVLGVWDQESMSKVSQENSLWARRRAMIIAKIHVDEWSRNRNRDEYLGSRITCRRSAWSAYPFFREKFEKHVPAIFE